MPDHSVLPSNALKEVILTVDKQIEKELPLSMAGASSSFGFGAHERSPFSKVKK